LEGVAILAETFRKADPALRKTGDGDALAASQIHM